MGKLSSAAKKLMQENSISRDSLENFAGRLESFAGGNDNKDLQETSEEILEESKKLNETAENILEALKPSLDDLEADREKKSVVKAIVDKKSSGEDTSMTPGAFLATLSAGFLFGDKLIGAEVARRVKDAGKNGRAPRISGTGKGRGRPTRTMPLPEPPLRAPGGTNPLSNFFERGRGRINYTSPRIPNPLTSIGGLLAPRESVNTKFSTSRIEPTITSRTAPTLGTVPVPESLGFIEVDTPRGTRFRDTETGKFISNEEAEASRNRIAETRRNALRAIRAADEGFMPAPQTQSNTSGPQSNTSGRSSGSRAGFRGEAGKRFHGQRSLARVERLARQILSEGGADVQDIEKAEKVLKAIKYLKILAVIGAAAEVVSIAIKLYNGESVRNELIALIVSIGTGYVGAVIGAAGASFVVPGVGTIIGGAIGAFAGAYGGAYVAEKLADIILGEERAPAPTGREISIFRSIKNAVDNGTDPNIIAEQIAMGIINPGASSQQRVNDKAYYWTPLTERPDASLTLDQLQTKYRILDQAAQSRAAINQALTEGKSEQSVTVNVTQSSPPASPAQNTPVGGTYRGGGGVANVLDSYSDPVGWVN